MLHGLQFEEWGDKRKIGNTSQFLSIKSALGCEHCEDKQLF